MDQVVEDLVSLVLVVVDMVDSVQILSMVVKILIQVSQSEILLESICYW
jgi:hypothetical protein